MPSLADLRAKLLSIPGKRDKKNLIGKLRQYDTAFGTIETSISECVGFLENGMRIFPELRTESMSSNLLIVRKAAEKIEERLKDDANNILSKYVEDKFHDVRDKTGNLRANIFENWKRSVNGKLDKFSGLIRAASDAGVGGAKVVEATVGKLRNEANSPPTNITDVSRIVSQFEQLENAVEDLGLSGKGGEFLVAAAAGNADPRDLMDKEVIEYIDKYDLWNSLTVRLG